jgi:hypothetical protein
MDVLDVSVLVAKNLHLSYLAAEMLMAPFDYIAVRVLFG